ncbi:MAG: hypothetical protein ACFFC7_28040 [Candidatus Hermodarchaeota archaeon]
MIVIPCRRCLETQVLVLLLLVVLMLHPPVFTLTQAPTWSQMYGGEEYDAAFALIQTTDGGYALAGWTHSYGAGNYDSWLVKTDGSNFSITLFGYLTIGLIGSSVVLLTSRLVYRRYNKRRQKRATSKALMEDVS